MQVSGAFVCLMGMGVTFVGLSCIILLTMLMGKVMGAMDRRKTPEQIPLPAHPAVPADGLTDEIKIAIMAAIAQEHGFNMA
ncbi:MAG: OadG family protein, partial [Oscillospiraceae bacterium]|nr:OadG family protein [Oscillospiraceae bacterium]